ncbi:T6SS effector BTH_I2691 family protein [Pseudomonas sp. PSKL.D1]|uniref:T6SS effector BTH_I2691 family protein n=1 Tax=Pseudomonas sp. PSKL.D1 TaxID=3029060 RepID=UPI00238137A4|nr:T6SS effector BTH_I2691 family protein [Pseudomonas sp. PSKL.D1]WDY56304.1 hypothetical protein PVV54_17050 [Pseudomonas sp. PSKL.D1]
MSISQLIATTVAEVALPLDQCNACERQGLPILPLRKALVPFANPADNARVDTRLGLRTLRMGYLYVLLDQSIWQAYEVTEHGHLRRFNPYQPPPGPPPALPERCVNQDHDVPSCFLNIDTATYGSAWVAFSSDAWPVSVLDAYKNGAAPAHRFEGLDLIQARNNPELLGMAMTPDNLQVDRQVFEYAQQLPGPFDSAHGFHSRLLRKTALRGFVVNAMAAHQLENGVLAIVLDDTVGLAQEYNHQRLHEVVQRQTWREDPMRAYQLQTSQILQIIRATHREWAAQKIIPRHEPHTGDGPPMFKGASEEYQRMVDAAQQDSDDRLEERYDEPRRAAFQAEYEQQEAVFQQRIDQQARAYVALCESPAFRLIEQYDYDGTNRDSGIAYSKTMATCLAGGVTEAPSAEPRPPAPGTTEALWLKWLQDPDSPAYRAVLMRDRPLLEAFLPSFSSTEPVNWNDSEKLYTAVSKIITSDDVGVQFRNQLRQAVAETLGALNGASQRLQAQLAPGIQQAVRRLNSATQLLYNGVHLVELQVQMKVSEYYALQSAHLRKMQNQASQAMAKARERLMPSLDDLNDDLLRSARKVTPIIQTGLLSLAVLDPKVAHTVINVSVWVEGKAVDLHERLAREVKLNVNQMSHAAQLTLVDLSVAAGTLEPGARRMLEGMKISAQQASQLVQESFTGLRGAAGSWQFLLTLGGMYLLSDSLGKNVKKAEQEIGQKSMEARMALYSSSLGILGGGTELSGLLIKKTSPSLFARGERIVRLGAAISAAAGLFDTIQGMISAHRTSTTGDITAHKLYMRSTFFAGLGVIAAGFAVVFSTKIIGLLGASISLTLIASYLNKAAEENESKLLERWVMRCFFGKATEIPRIHWPSPEYADIAIAELNAAALGLSGDLSFKTTISTSPDQSKIGGRVSLTTKQWMEFRFTLPRFSESTAGYHWTLVIHRQGDGNAPTYAGGEVVINQNFHTPHVATRTSDSTSLKPIKTVQTHDLKSETLILNSSTQTAKDASDGNHSHKTVTGTLELAPDPNKHNILAASLLISYWPDKSLPESYGEILIQTSKQ